MESRRPRPARTQRVKQKAESAVAALVRRGIVNACSTTRSSISTPGLAS